MNPVFISEILEYFESKNASLHVTAMFTSRGKPPGAMDYINDPIVKQSMGKCYLISTIGYVITPYSFGARVRLTDEELELWGQDDDELRPDNLMTRGNFIDKKETNPSAESGENDDDNEISDVLDLCEQRIRITDQKPNESRFYPTSGRGSRAHFTLGVAPGMKPVTTGFDLIDVISCEQRIKEENGGKTYNENAMDVDTIEEDVPTYNFSGAVIKCYGEGRWVIYPETKVIAESFFSALY